MKDTIFKSEKRPEKFIFDEQIARVFDNMLTRSVPFYGEVQKMISCLTADYYKPSTTIYDLGCSTGTTLINICNKMDISDIKIVGVDSSKPVISKAGEKIHSAGLKDKIELVCDDILNIPIENASIIIMNYTLQFVAPAERQQLLKKIYDGLVSGGILLLSEKTVESDSKTDNLFIEKYHAYKRENGYSDLEISKKREALEEVLIPYSVDEEFELLNSAGFESSFIFFKWFNFTSFMAIKN